MPQQFYLKGTNEALLITDKPFASGGEGALYDILQPANYVGGYVAKIIHAHKLNPIREAKVNYLIANRPQFEYNPEHQPIIWIEKALYNEKNEFAGFIMPRASGEKLEILCAPSLPKRLGTEWQQLGLGTEKALRLRLKVCYNIALAVQQIHATGRYVLVDLKPDNVMIQPNGLISLVDTDSVEIVEKGQMLYSATVATPDYTPPEYYAKGMEVGKTPIDESWDRFSLSVIFYRIMLGIHPFAASCTAPYDNLAALADKIKYGFFAHDKGKQHYFLVIPPPHAAFRRLDEEIQALFIQTFDQGHENPEARARPTDWLAVLPNSAAAIVARDLPSDRLNIPNIQSQNWYETAINQILDELNLQQAPNPATVKNKNIALPTATVSRSGLIIERLGALLAEKRTTLIVSAFALLGFLLVGGRMVRLGISELFIIILLLGIIGLIYFWIKAANSIDINQIGKTIQNKYKQIRNRRKLEEAQHKLFAQRVELKQRQKELATELSVVEGVKSKRDKNFLKNQSALVKQVQQKATERLQKNSQIQNPDDAAQQLMIKEAREVKQIRQDFAQLLQAHPVFSLWEGQMPMQKIQQINYKAAALNNSTNTEKNSVAAQWRKELETMQYDIEAQTAAIKADYDAAHEALFAEATNQKEILEIAISREIKAVRKEIDLDNKLFDASYREILRTRVQLLTEAQNQEQKVEILNDDIRQLREALAALP